MAPKTGYRRSAALFCMVVLCMAWAVSAIEPRGGRSLLEDDHDEDNHEGEEAHDDDHKEEAHEDDDHEDEDGHHEDEDDHDHDHDHEDERDNRVKGEKHDDHENDDDHEDDDDHDHDHDHDHDEHESAIDHIMEDFGGKNAEFLVEDDIAELFERLIEGGEDDHDDHGHDHGHGHDEEASETLSPHKLLEDFGTDGKLSPENLNEACTSILLCQLEPGCELEADHHDDHDDHDDEKTGTLKLVVAIVFFVESVIGTAIVMFMGKFSSRVRTVLGVLNAFGGGVFLTTGVVHLIPEVLESEAQVDGLDDYPLGTVIVVIGFLMVFFVEHILFDVHSSVDSLFTNEETATKAVKGADDQTLPKTAESQELKESKPTGLMAMWAMVHKPIILLAAISVHAILEAIVVGLEDEKSGVLLLFASIASHKGVVALSLTARFMQNGATKMQVLLFMGAFALIAPLGILIGWASDNVDPLIRLILDGLATGTFLYVGAYEIVAEEFHDHTGRNEIKTMKYAAVVIGSFLIALAQLVPHDHDH